VPHILAIANQKGGVGKTTTAVNLAASLAVAEQRTLLIDGDPQGNATSGIGLQREGLGATVYDVLLGGATAAQALHRGVQFTHLDVLPATPDLAGAEVELIGRHRRDQAMRDALTPLAEDYDYVLIDCPPSLGLITLNMLAAADALVIPVQCEYYALEGLSQLLNTVHLVQQSVNPQLSIEGVLLTMYDARLNLSRQVAADAREYFGPKVYDSVIPRNVRLAEAPSFGKPIILYDVTSAGAQAYMSVARELLSRHRPEATIGTAPHARASSSPSPETADLPSAIARADVRRGPQTDVEDAADHAIAGYPTTPIPGSAGGTSADSVTEPPPAVGERAAADAGSTNRNRWDVDDARVTGRGRDPHQPLDARTDDGGPEVAGGEDGGDWFAATTDDEEDVSNSLGNSFGSSLGASLSGSLDNSVSDPVIDAEHDPGLGRTDVEAAAPDHALPTNGSIREEPTLDAG
jgi:chromosome partitioning protein